MTDHIEEVARAICVALGIDPDKMTYDIISGKDIPAWKIEANVARAAIAAYQQAVASEAVAWHIPGGISVTKDKDVTDRWKFGNPDRAIEPLFAAPTAPQPRIKPLVWEVRHPNDLYIARSIFGEFGVWDGHFRAPWHIAGVAAANPKADAQADYETRILSALESAPTPGAE